MINNKRLRVATVTLLTIAFAISTLSVSAQDRLKTMPGYDQNQKMSGQIQASVKMGGLNVKWQDDAKSFDYYKDGKTYRYDLATRTATETGPAPADAENPRMGRRRAAG